MPFAHNLTIILLSLGVSGYASAVTNECPPETDVALQVLGSGGPIADDARASSGYLIWVDGESRVLIDAGSGVAVRFREARADFQALDFIGLSHFHTDPSADLPALLKGGYFSDRRRALIVAGADAGGPFPGRRLFLKQLLGKNTGAYSYLAGYLNATEDLPMLSTFEIDSTNTEAVTVLGDRYSSMQIDTMHVAHGIGPALVFRVRVNNRTIVFSGDQNVGNNEFVHFAKNANILVMHMPIPEGTTGPGRNLHAPPSVVGAFAMQANVKMLLLSHLMKRSLRNLGQT